jgi:hypothetical protein
VIALPESTSVRKRGTRTSFADFVGVELRARKERDAAALGPTIAARHHSEAIERLAQHVGSLPPDSPVLNALSLIDGHFGGSSAEWTPTSQQAKTLAMVGQNAPPSEVLADELVAAGVEDLLVRVQDARHEVAQHETRVVDLSARLAFAEERAQEAEEGLSTATARIQGLEGELSELKSQLDYFREQQEPPKKKQRAAA